MGIDLGSLEILFLLFRVCAIHVYRNCSFTCTDVFALFITNGIFEPISSCQYENGVRMSTVRFVKLSKHICACMLICDFMVLELLLYSKIESENL